MGQQQIIPLLSTAPVRSESTLFNLASFSNLTNFTVTNTGGATNNVSGGVIQLRGGDQNGTHHLLEYNPYGHSCLLDWKLSAIVVIQENTVGSNGKSVGFGCKNYGGGSSLYGSLSMDGTWGKGKVMITDYNAYTTISSSALAVLNTGDHIQLDFENRNGALTLTATNLTSGGQVSLTSTLSISTTLYSVPSNWTFTIAHSNGSVDVASLTATSKEWSSPDLVIVGDSITTGAYGGNGTGATYYSGWAQQVRLHYEALGRKVVIYAGGGMKTTDFSSGDLYTKMLAFNGAKYLIALGTNDALGGASTTTFTNTLTTIKTAINGQGGVVAFRIVIPCDSTDMRPYNTALHSVFSTSTIVDDFSTLADSGTYTLNNIYSSDPVHPYKAGHDEMATATINANLI